MPTLEKVPGFTLWISGPLPPLPCDHAEWHKLDQGLDRAALERQARSLRPFMVNRRFAVVEGSAKPHWRPAL